MTNVTRISGAKIFALTLALFLLFPPAVFWGTYSHLEVALILLAVALLPDGTVNAHPLVAFPTALVALVSLMVASSVWSAASWSSIRDASTYAILVLAAALIARSISVGQIAFSVAAMGLVVLAASGLAAIATPERAIDSWGLLQGIYGNRNSLGYVLVQAMPAMIALPLRFRGGVVVRILGLAALGWGIWETGAKTALVSGLLVVAVWIAITLVRRWRLALVGVTLVMLLAAVVALLNFDRLLAVLGKDDTGSGRTEIWAALLPIIGDHPVFGAGWAMSWPAGSPQYEAMVAAFGAPFFHAHNEVINWLVTLGIVGLVFVIAVYGFAAWSGWKMFVARESAASFVLLTLVMVVSRGLTEISETSAQGWLVLMLAVAVGARFIASRPGRMPEVVLLQIPRAQHEASRQMVSAEPIAM